MPRVKTTLHCQNCKTRNYFTTKNKKIHSEKLLLKKYCDNCRKIFPHAEKEL